MPPPLKLAIIGGGPSAFYVASRLLQLLPRSQTLPNALGNAVRVHMFDRLWTPHGLVRYGVAPDHPEVKASRLNCTHKFDEVAIHDPRFSFFGNTSVGQANYSMQSRMSEMTPTYLSHTLPLELAQILQNYSHLLIATGSPLSKLHPSLFGQLTSQKEERISSTPPASPLMATRVLPALSLVHWYTQHPSNPPAPPLESTRHVTIIGMGNVALDVARMLLSSVDRLERGEPPETIKSSTAENTSHIGYDLPMPVLSLLRRSAVEHVSILGRRGPLEAAFTARELREMIGLHGVKMHLIEQSVLEDARKTKVSRQQGRILQLLEKANSSGGVEDNGTAERSWSLKFFHSPLSVRPASPNADHGKKLELEVAHTKLEQVESASGVSVVAVPTGKTSTIPTDMVVTSLGFQPEKGDVYDQLVDIISNQTETLGKARSDHIPTDSQGRVLLHHSDSRTADVGTSSQMRPSILKSIYTSGWASMGARGVLAATMADAYGVAETIVRDYTASIENSALKEESTSRAEGVAQESIQLLNPSPESTLPPRPVFDALLDSESWRTRDALLATPPAEDAAVIESQVIPVSSSTGQAPARPSRSPSIKSGPFVLTYQDWKRIDEDEIRRGAELGKERERMTWDDVVNFLQQ